MVVHDAVPAPVPLVTASFSLGPHPPKWESWPFLLGILWDAACLTDPHLAPFGGRHEPCSRGVQADFTEIAG